MATNKTETDDKIGDLLRFCKGVPLAALRTSSKTQISNYLDKEGIPIGDYCNDWYGLAERIGYLYRDIKRFETFSSPTTSLLDNWASRPNLSPTVDKLISYLLEIQRPDVAEESAPNIRRDVENFKQPRKESTQQQLPVNDEGKRYDAFVAYGENPRDIQFVKEMISILEGEKYNIKLYVPGRDDIAGEEKYVVAGKMIAYRCRRIIVVLSRGFEASEYCDFALKLAQSLSPGAKSRRIVPILLDKVEIPSILRFVRVVDFTNPMQHEWGWGRIAKTIVMPLIPNMEDYINTIHDLKNRRYDSKAVAHMFYGLGVALQEFPDPDDKKKERLMKTDVC